jgi:hypothetical protein
MYVSWWLISADQLSINKANNVYALFRYKKVYLENRVLRIRVF